MAQTRNSTRKSNRVSAKTPVSSRIGTKASGRASVKRNGHTAAPANGKTNGKPGNGTLPNGNGKSQAKPVCQREQIMQERTTVMAELARQRVELLETPGATGDEVDLSVYDREKTLGLIKAFEHRLEELNAALAANAKGQYGICERCKQPIDAERLKIFPETRHCVKCKGEIERLARRGIVVR